MSNSGRTSLLVRRAPATMLLIRCELRTYFGTGLLERARPLRVMVRQSWTRLWPFCLQADTEAFMQQHLATCCSPHERRSGVVGTSAAEEAGQEAAGQESAAEESAGQESATMSDKAEWSGDVERSDEAEDSCSLSAEDFIASVGNDTDLMVGMARHALDGLALLRPCIDAAPKQDGRKSKVGRQEMSFSLNATLDATLDAPTRALLTKVEVRLCQPHVLPSSSRCAHPHHPLIPCGTATVDRQRARRRVPFVLRWRVRSGTARRLLRQPIHPY